MDKFIITMTEFMERFGHHLGFPRDRVLEMARDHFVTKEDFQFVIRDVLYTVPLISLEEWFGPKEKPVEEPTSPKFPKTQAQKKADG